VFYVILNKPPLIYDSYAITFTGQTTFESMDIFEGKLVNKLKAQVNIQSMILSRVK